MKNKGKGELIISHKKSKTVNTGSNESTKGRILYFQPLKSVIQIPLCATFLYRGSIVASY